MAVKPIPDGYHTATPYLTLDDAAAAIAYYEKAFGAKERKLFAPAKATALCICFHPTRSLSLKGDGQYAVRPALRCLNWCCLSCRYPVCRDWKC